MQPNSPDCQRFSTSCKTTIVSPDMTRATIPKHCLVSIFDSGQTPEQSICVDNLVPLWERLFYLLRIPQSETAEMVSLIHQISPNQASQITTL